MYKIYQAETVDSAIKQGLDELNVSEADIRIDVEARGSKGFFGIGKKESVVKLTIINPELKTFDSIEALIQRNQHNEPSSTDIKDTPENELSVTDITIEETRSKEQSQKETAPQVHTPDDDTEPVSAKTDIKDSEPEFKEPEKEKKISIQQAAEDTSDYVSRVISDMQINHTVSYRVTGSDVWVEVETPLAAKLIGKRGQTLNALQEVAQHYFNGIYKSYGSVVMDVENYRQKRKETLENLAVNMSKKAVRTGESVKLEPMPAFERKIMHNVLGNLKDIETRSEGKDPHRYIVIEKR